MFKENKINIIRGVDTASSVVKLPAIYIYSRVEILPNEHNSFSLGLNPSNKGCLSQ